MKKSWNSWTVCIGLLGFVMSFKLQNDVTQSNAMTDVILQCQLTSASVHFPCSFKTVTLLFHITWFLSIGSIDEVCLIFLSYFSTKTYAVGIQNSLNETVEFFEHPKQMFILPHKKKLGKVMRHITQDWVKCFNANFRNIFGPADDIMVL